MNNLQTSAKSEKYTRETRSNDGKITTKFYFVNKYQDANQCNKQKQQYINKIKLTTRKKANY